MTVCTSSAPLVLRAVCHDMVRTRPQERLAVAHGVRKRQSDRLRSSHTHGNGGGAGISAPIAPSTPPAERREAYQELLSLAHRKTGLIPAPLLARHVLSVTSEADWPVQRAAMEALLRRCKFAKQDALKIASRPAGKTEYGRYRTKRAGSSGRPYTTLLAGIEPLRASCDCADFVRNSLGLCKHVLTVLEDLAGRGNRRGGHPDEGQGREGDRL